MLKEIFDNLCMEVILLFAKKFFSIVVVHNSSDDKIVMGITMTIDKEFANFTEAFSQAKTSEEYLGEIKEK